MGSAELLGIVTAAPTVTTPDSGAGAAVHGTGASANAQVNAESAGSQTSADSAVSDSKTAVASDASATAASRAETAASDAAVAANAPEGSSLEASDNKVASSDCAPASAEHKHGMRAMSAHSDRSQNETVERANSIKHSTGRRHATESQERVWRQSDIGERRAQEAAPERWVSSTVRARYGASSAHARFDERVLCECGARLFYVGVNAEVVKGESLLKKAAENGAYLAEFVLVVGGDCDFHLLPFYKTFGVAFGAFGEAADGFRDVDEVVGDSFAVGNEGGVEHAFVGRTKSFVQSFDVFVRHLVAYCVDFVFEFVYVGKQSQIVGAVFLAHFFRQRIDF